MIIRLVPEARREFLEAILTYEAAAPGLGQRFKDEVDASISWAADHVELFRLRARRYRRINLRAFPYYVPFIEAAENFWVLGVAHASRKPLYWISRRERLQA